MELLTPLNTYYTTYPPTEADVIRLGIDMCRALEVCAKENIIHRDIKPSNIFVSEHGDYKLGDFGVARHLEASCRELSKKGTYDYMAPEVYRDSVYDARADIFSLGIVLYKLMNNGRIPFLPAGSRHPSATTTAKTPSSGVYAAKCRFRRSMPILRSPKSFCKPAKEIPMRGFLRPRRCVRL